MGCNVSSPKVVETTTKKEPEELNKLDAPATTALANGELPPKQENELMHALHVGFIIIIILTNFFLFFLKKSVENAVVKVASGMLLLTKSKLTTKISYKKQLITCYPLLTWIH